MLIEATTQSVLGPVYTLNGNDDLNIAEGIVITSLGPWEGDPASTADGLTTWSGQHHITVAGTIHTYDDGINTIGCEPAQLIEIAATGVILTGNNHVAADADGIILDGQNSRVVNYGSITAEGTGIAMFVRAGGTTTIENHGTISGQVAAIHYKFGDGIMELTNHGTIESPNWSYLGKDHIDHVINQGTMIGDIDLAQGDDIYNGKGGTVDGIIYAGAGNDTLTPGDGTDIIDGGDGIDRLDFTAKTRWIKINLADAAQNRGHAAVGDVYNSIEEVLGGSAADKLRGDTADNLLAGKGGDDVLAGANGNDTLLGGEGNDSLSGGAGADSLDGGEGDDVIAGDNGQDLLLGGEGNDSLSGGAGVDILDGGAGDDWLCGGAGADSLSGGLGADSFVFDMPGTRDFVLDFESGVDHVLISAAGFGLDLLPGAIDPAIFARGAFALDADDRFLFRPADATLRYDADGDGPGASVLIARFADGTVLTSADILIY